VTLFDYDACLKRGALQVPMTVRAESWPEAQALLVAGLPPDWKREAIFTIKEMRQVVADAAKAEVLEARIHELEQSLAESNSQVEVERGAAAGMAATINAQQRQMARMQTETDAFGRALVKIVRMDDSAGALDEAKGWARDAFAEVDVTIPGVTEPAKIIIPTDSEES
jgi:hypothetical protein